MIKILYRLKGNVHQKLTSLLSVKGIVYMILSLFIVCSFYRHIENAFGYKTGRPLASSSIQLENGVEYRQKLKKYEGVLQKIHIMFGTNARINTGALCVVLQDDTETIQTWRIDVSELKDAAFHEFKLNKKLCLSAEKTYYLGLTETYAGDNSVAVYTSAYGEFVKADDTVLRDNSICYLLTLEDARQKKIYQVLYTLCVVLLMVCGVAFIDFNRFNIGKSILICVTILVLFRIIDFDLLQNFATRKRVLTYQISDNYKTIGAESSANYVLSVDNGSFDSLEIFPEQDYRKRVQKRKIHVKICNIESGHIFFDEDLEEDSVVGDGDAGRVAFLFKLKETALRGHYLITLSNRSRKSMRISVLADGSINTCAERITFIAHKMAIGVLAILAILVLVAISKIKADADISKIYLTVVIPLSIAYCSLFAPWAIPDAQAHFMATYRLSNIVMGYGDKLEWYGREEDVNFYEHVWAGRNLNPEIGGYSALIDNLNVECRKSDMVPFSMPMEHMEYYSIVGYLPQVIGLSLGRALNLGTVLSIYLARLAVLIFYILLTYHAVRKTPLGKGIIAMTASLPMCLMMSSAISYDTMVIIACLNFVTSILCLYADRRSKMALIEAMFWTFVVGAVKGGGYLILLPLVLLLLCKEEKIRSVLQMTGIIAMGAASAVIFDVILPAGMELFQFGTEGTGKMAISFAFQNPIGFFNMSVKTYMKYMDSLLFAGTGTHLAWLEFVVPYIIVILMLTMGGIYAIFEQDSIFLKRKDKYIMIATAALMFLTTPAMLLSWTPVGSQTIEGLQGRYYLPLLPCIFFVLTKFSLHVPLKNAVDGAVIRRKAMIWYVTASCVAAYFLIRLYLTR